MELLFKREQKSSLMGRVTFKLWGTVEFDEEETALVKRYDFNRAILIIAKQPKLFRKACFAGLISFIILGSIFLLIDFLSRWFIGWFVFSYVASFAEKFGMYGIYTLSPNFMWFALATLISIGRGYHYFHKHRGTILVRDLIHGRYFACDSVIDLARKEAWLETICAYFRQVMESAKHWDGTAHIPIEALPKDEARQVIIRGL